MDDKVNAALDVLGVDHVYAFSLVDALQDRLALRRMDFTAYHVPIGDHP
jgi:hypothetical protein